MLPVQVGPDVPETSPLEQRREVIVQGIRDGFVAAYDVFKGAAGAKLPEGVTSADLAEVRKRNATRSRAEYLHC